LDFKNNAYAIAVLKYLQGGKHIWSTQTFRSFGA